MNKFENINKKTIALISIFFLLTFSSFKYVPGLFFTAEIWILYNILFIALIFIPEKIRDNFLFNRLEIYILFLIVYVPLTSAIQSSSEFGQPLIFGLLAQRGIFVTGSSLILLHFYRKGYFVIRDIEYSLVFLAWLNLIACSLGLLFLDPEQFSDVPTFVTQETDIAKFKFSTEFIVFGFFYYAFSGFWLKSKTKSFLSLFFLSFYIFGSGTRTIIISLFITYLLLVIKWSSMRKVFTRVTTVMLTLSTYVFIFYLIDSDKFNHLIEKFIAAFQVVFTGQLGDDSSANARILEGYLALPFVIKNWFLGNGLVSNQWNGGFNSIFDYFYPVDIGLLGMIFIYGVLGAIIFCYQFKLAINYIYLLPNYGDENSNLISALKGVLLSCVISSVASGQFINYIEQDLILISILYCATFDIIKRKIKCN